VQVLKTLYRPSKRVMNAQKVGSIIPCTYEMQRTKYWHYPFAINLLKAEAFSANNLGARKRVQTNLTGVSRAINAHKYTFPIPNTHTKRQSKYWCTVFVFNPLKIIAFATNKSVMKKREMKTDLVDTSCVVNVNNRTLIVTISIHEDSCKVSALSARI
jgi:hypothetical protein